MIQINKNKILEISLYFWYNSNAGLALPMGIKTDSNGDMITYRRNDGKYVQS